MANLAGEGSGQGRGDRVTSWQWTATDGQGVLSWTIFLLSEPPFFPFMPQDHEKSLLAPFLKVLLSAESQAIPIKELDAN